MTRDPNLLTRLCSNLTPTSSSRSVDGTLDQGRRSSTDTSDPFAFVTEFTDQP